MNATPGSMSGILHMRLAQAFAPESLEVIDESESHRGHGGWREGGETHFRVVMRATSLAGLSRVERSRAVHKVLAAELAGGVARAGARPRLRPEPGSDGNAPAFPQGRQLSAGPIRGAGRSGVGGSPEVSPSRGSTRNSRCRRCA